MKTMADLLAGSREIRQGFHLFALDPAEMSVTVEDAQFLYALVRVTKPRAVMESGTGNGISTVFMATALRENGVGYLDSYEPLREFADPARNLLGDDLPATVHHGDTPPWHERTDDDLGLVFLDSAMHLRKQEIEHWLTCGYKGLVVVHDAERLYPELNHGVGVFLPGADGLWVGRGR